MIKQVTLRVLGIFLLLSFSLSSFATTPIALWKKHHLHHETHRIERLLLEASIAQSKGHYSQAILLHQRILHLQPQNLNSLNAIALLYGKQGNFAKEISWAKKVIAANPRNDAGYLNFGHGLMGVGKFLEAKHAYQRAFILNPQSSMALYSLGQVAEHQQNYPLAIKLFEKTLEINPRFVDVYFNLAAAYSDLRQYDRAIVALKKVISLDGPMLDARAMLADVERAKRKFSLTRPVGF